MSTETTELSSASTCGGMASWREFHDLVRASKNAIGRIENDIRKECVECYDPAAATIRRLLGRDLQGTTALEVGPGQWLAQARYFGRWAKVTGIDLDVLPQGFDIPGYMRMWRDNGWRRVAKTLGRKVLGFDRQVHSAYERVLGRVDQLPRVRQMNATKMTFGANEFDFAYSFNVLEHVPDPGAVFRECARVVRSGGVVYHDVHLYTSDTGCHDPRIISHAREDLPVWPHLRSETTAAMVRYGGYLNKLTLAQWHEIISSSLPGAEVSYRKDTYDLDALAKARAAGELSGFTDDELTVRNIVVAWRKP
jgi:SAM-dependent methyltransferase